MSRLIFSGPAELQLPTPSVLRFLDRQVDFVAYEVTGFEESLLLLDYRSSQQTTHGLRPGASLTAVPTNFQYAAHLEIWEFSPDHLQIELHDTIRTQAPWVFSLVLTPGQIQPNRRAFFQRIAPVPDSSQAVMTLNRQVGKTPLSAPAPMLAAIPA
ncbi:MAG: hypothetical protein M5U34_15350 [Chloroflexi bacterium]|nr:hypothetical protein [Chloroflexota bacterium]